MPKFNEMFELSIEDVAVIENSLRKSLEDLSSEHREAGVAGGAEREVNIREIHDLLGKLHNQKIFYRPRDEVYIGG